LRHRDIDENDATLHDMESEVDEQPRQKNAGHDGPKHYLPHKNSGEHRRPTCCVRQLAEHDVFGVKRKEMSIPIGRRPIGAGWQPALPNPALLRAFVSII
jgi:hypothetical protein